MAVIDYRQLEAPAAIDTRTLDDGSAQAAESLAHAFKSFSNDTSELGQTINASAGAKAGEMAGAEGNPKFKNGFLKYTAYSQAYNNAATRSYAIRAEVDAEDTAARLEVQAGTDPAHFNATFQAVRDATVKAAPPEVRGLLMDMYNKRLGEGMARVITAQQQEYQKQARVDVSEGISRTTDRVANWSASDDPQLHAQAADEQVKLRLLIDGAANDGTISQTEAQSLFIESQRAITSQTVTAKFKKELNNPFGDPVGFIERVQKSNAEDQLLPPAEGAKLVKGLMEAMTEKNALDAFDKRKNGTDEHHRYEAGDRTATAQLLAGTLTQKTLLDMVTSQNLKPEVARTLKDQLEKGDTAKDDPKVAFEVKTSLLQYDEHDIATMPGLTWKTRSEMIMERRKAVDDWRGTQDAKEAEERIDRALGIVPGIENKLLTPDQLRQRGQAKNEFYNQMSQTEPALRQGAALSTADKVIGTFIRKNKAQEAVTFSSAKQRFIQSEKMSHGDPGSYGAKEKAAYDARIANYDKQIAAAQAEAARQ